MRKLDPAYKYEKWLGFFTHCEPYRYYDIDQNRPDREDFIEALKQLGDFFGVISFNNSYTKFMRLDPLSLVKELHESFKKEGALEDYKKEIDNFYTRAYNPEEIEKQRKLHESLPKSDIPGTTVRYESTQTSFSPPQTNDHLSGGISGHSEENNASTGLKQSQNKNNKNEKNTEW